jgi:hypothetical protein
LPSVCREAAVARGETTLSTEFSTPGTLLAWVVIPHLAISH